ncbi:hypothetical protein ACOMHN_038900 [Nucella lapillus]
MASCIPMGHSAKMRTKNTQTHAPLAPNSDRNNITKPKADRNSCFPAFEEAGKGQHASTDKQHQGWLAKVRNKLRNRQHRRPERCEKCGQKSDTCQANASFITSCKHYLCEKCRVSSDAMKDMYQQMCRNLSLHEPPRVVGGSGGANGELSPLTSSRQSRGVVRSRSMRTRPLPAPESGYDTATSQDSSCSCSRLSPESVYGSPGERGPCALRPDCGSHHCAGFKPLEPSFSKENHPNHKDKPDVFGGAFKSERTPLRDIQPGLQTKIYTRQDPTPHYRPKQTAVTHHQTPATGKDTADNYDGYLEIRNPNSKGVKYVFKQQREDCDGVLENDEVQSDHLSRRKHTENLKLCFRCEKFRCIAFRAPFDQGWLCEDCMDDLM